MDLVFPTGWLVARNSGARGGTSAVRTFAAHRSRPITNRRADLAFAESLSTMIFSLRRPTSGILLATGCNKAFG